MSREIWDPIRIKGKREKKGIRGWTRGPKKREKKGIRGWTRGPYRGFLWGGPKVLDVTPPGAFGPPHKKPL